MKKLRREIDGMLDWIYAKIGALTWGDIGLGVGLFLLSFSLSFLAIAIVIVKIPAAYFSSHYNEDFMPGSPFLIRWGAVLLKNLLGVFLVGLGIVLSLPGVPGQGLLTILVGIMMLDIPGKRPLEARLIQRPTILGAVNRLRERFGKPPLIMD